MRMNKTKIGILIIALIILLGVGVFVWYINSLKAVTKSEEFVTLEIEEGMGVKSIANLLEKNRSEERRVGKECGS